MPFSRRGLTPKTQPDRPCAIAEDAARLAERPSERLKENGRSREYSVYD